MSQCLEGLDLATVLPVLPDLLTSISTTGIHRGLRQMWVERFRKILQWDQDVMIQREQRGGWGYVLLIDPVMLEKWRWIREGSCAEATVTTGRANHQSGHLLLSGKNYTILCPVIEFKLHNCRCCYPQFFTSKKCILNITKLLSEPV